MTYEPTLARRGPTRGTPKTAVPDTASFIPRSQLLEVYNAFLFAEERRLHLNTWITINFRASQGWKPGDRSDGQIARTRDRFLAGIRQWCRRQDLPHALVYGLENPRHGGHGPHQHILQHLPPEDWPALQADLYEFLKRFGGWPDSSFLHPPASDDAATGSPQFEQRWKPLFIEPQPMSERPWWQSSHVAMRRLRYICKGADPGEVLQIDGERVTLGQLAERHLRFGFERREAEDGSHTWVNCERPGVALKPQGNVRVGKRAGSSATLGKAERRRLGWDDRKDLIWMCHKVYQRQMITQALRDRWARSTVLPAAPVEESDRSTASAV